MPRAELAITIPQSVWMGDLSRAHPDTGFEILTAFPREGGGVALAEITGGDVTAVVSEMDGYEEVQTVDVLEHTGDGVLLQFETSDPLLLLPVRNAGTPLEMPFTVSDGTVNWEVRAPRDRLSRLADQLREFDIEFDVESIHREISTDRETGRPRSDSRRGGILRHSPGLYADRPRGDCRSRQVHVQRDAPPCRGADHQAVRGRELHRRSGRTATVSTSPRTTLGRYRRV
jgi:hypothetical protein